MVRIHTLHYIVKALKAVRFCYGQSTDTEQFGIHAVVNALGSVVDKYTVPSLKNLCFGVKAAYTCLLTFSDLIDLIG